MTRTVLMALVCAGAVLAAPQKEAKSDVKVYRLEWRDLERIVRGRQIDMTLPSGIRLRGNVLAVEPDELVMDVRKTSDKHAYPKGRSIVPRPEVKRLRVVEKKGYTWRGVGIGIGAAIGTLVAIPLATYAANTSGEAAKAVALSVGIPVGLGYLAGWSADRKVMDVVVVEGGF